MRRYYYTLIREVKRFKLCVAIPMMKKHLIGKVGVTDHNGRLVSKAGKHCPKCIGFRLRSTQPTAVKVHNKNC